MSPSSESLFPPRDERAYDAAAVERFPWPVVAGYDEVHRWMDQGQAVHAAWQLKDVWEGLLKFLSDGLAVADHLAWPRQMIRAAENCSTSCTQEGRLDRWRLGEAVGNGPQGRSTARSARLHRSSDPGCSRAASGNDFFACSPATRTMSAAMTSSPGGTLTFGHGVFRKDLRSYADDALHWLRRLHEAFDLCRPLLESLMLESDGPRGEIPYVG